MHTKMEAAKQAIDSLVDVVATRVLRPNDGVIKVQVFPERKAILAAENPDKFPVLVRVTAAAATSELQQQRIGVDVVAVLDTSESMKEEKLEEVKKAMAAFIGELRDDDRLSIVSFWSKAERVMGLTEMKEGRAAAIGKVQELAVKPGTNMVAGLKEGAEVLSEREGEEQSSRLGCMMFLSDGDDKEIRQAKIDNKFPASTEYPAYTFGMGAKHDAAVLKYIADETCGTYSFVNKDTSKITGAIESFAAGLTSVAATSVEITLKAGEGTTIASIESGGYSKFVKNNETINIPDIYTGEVKNFIVYLNVKAKDPNGRMSRLLEQMPCLDQKQLIMTVGGKYKIVGNSFPLANRKVSVLRPRLESECSSGELASTHPKVAAELTRIELEKGISDMVAKDTITGDGLQALWEKIEGSDNGKATPKVTLLKFGKEVAEMQTRIESAAASAGDDRRKSWLPYILSWLSSYTWQRGTTKDDDDGDEIIRPRPRPRPRPRCCSWPPSALHLVIGAVVALLFFLAAVIHYSSGGYGYGFGLNPAAAPDNATSIDLAGHPAWPEMEQNLQAITRRASEDVQITSYFREASVEDMNLQMDRYLYMAIVHATVLRGRSAGSSISDKSAVRREAESYLRIMLTRMKNVDIPSFQTSSAEFITYEMNRYLYSTIVQASVLRGSYTSSQDVAIDDVLPGGGRMINVPKPVTDAPALGAFIDGSVLTKDTSTTAATITSSEATRITSEAITVLEEQKETLVVQVTELEQSRETLMVRITEMELVLQERETLVVSLRSELELQRESCAQRAAMAETRLRTCAQTVDMWKAKVVAMGGRIDGEETMSTRL